MDMIKDMTWHKALHDMEGSTSNQSLSFPGDHGWALLSKRDEYGLSFFHYFLVHYFLLFHPHLSTSLFFHSRSFSSFYIFQSDRFSFLDQSSSPIPRLTSFFSSYSPPTLSMSSTMSASLSYFKCRWWSPHNRPLEINRFMRRRQRTAACVCEWVCMCMYLCMYVYICVCKINVNLCALHTSA